VAGFQVLDRKHVADIFKDLLERRSFVDQAPVQPRHSWSTNKPISSWTMFNLTRHSHHHAQSEVPYQDRKPFPDAPMMINDYLTTLIVALIPPLWYRLMTPRVLAWDRDYATAEERQMAALANAKSGIPLLRRANGGAGAPAARMASNGL
jgi:hypothetical protein